MACLTFPNSGLVPGVTTHVVDNVTYRWDGTVWEAVTTSLDSSQITHDSSGTVKDTLDSNSEYMALKIFQSPTDDGLTEIQTRTVDAGEVYEVRKTSDDSLATIYSNAAGTTEIVQNGTSNVSGSNGVVAFYIADGDYYVEVGGIKSNFTDIVKATNVETSDGRNVQERLDDLPSEVDAAGTAATLIEDHNSDAGAHPEMSAFISSEADRATDEADRSETNANSAAVAANVYDDTTEGLSETVVGEQFQVLSDDLSEYIRYSHDASDVATEVGRFPASSFAFNLSDNQKSISFQNYESFDFEGFITGNGDLAYASSWLSTDFIAVEEGQIYTIQAKITGNARAAWYDENKDFVSSFAENMDGVVDYIAPESARFMRCSHFNNTTYLPYVRSKQARFNVDKLRSVLEQHNPTLQSKNITFDGETVEDYLYRIEENQENILTSISGLSDSIDLSTDKDSPFFINMQNFIKSYKTSARAEQLNVLSQSANNITVESGGGAKLAEGGSLISYNGSNHSSHGIKSISGDVVELYGDIPSGIQYVETMHESNNGQHLSRLGYKGLAEYMVDSVQKYAYKKEPTFSYNPSDYAPDGANISDGSEIVIPITTLGSAGTGGYVSGTTDLIKKCGQASSDKNVTQETLSKYLLRCYELADGIAGNGYQLQVPTKNRNGFVNMQAGLVARSYSSGSVVTSGTLQLTVLDQNDNTVYSKVFSDIGNQEIVFDYDNNVSYLTFKFELMQNEPTVFFLNSLYAYQKSPKTSTEKLFKNGDVVAFLGDSWTQFPIAESGETLPLRPDESTGDGMQFLSSHAKDYLAEQGVNITTLNMGKGGQTSAWGLYWVDSIINLTPKPTHCVVLFGINDNNSTDEFENGTPSAYDFDPNNQWVNLRSDEGGVFGSVDKELWFNNMKSISSRLISAGIKPVIMVVGHTGSGSQSQTIIGNYTEQLVDGFN